MTNEGKSGTIFAWKRRQCHATRQVSFHKLITATSARSGGKKKNKKWKRTNISKRLRCFCTRERRLQLFRLLLLFASTELSLFAFLANGREKRGKRWVLSVFLLIVVALLCMPQCNLAAIEKKKRTGRKRWTHAESAFQRCWSDIFVWQRKPQRWSWNENKPYSCGEGKVLHAKKKKKNVYSIVGLRAKTRC